jgi:hypothetical protein
MEKMLPCQNTHNDGQLPDESFYTVCGPCHINGK